MERDRQILTPGTKVIVKVRDWTPSASTVFSLTGTVHSKVAAPYGYNIKLDSPYTFTGNLPLPFSDQIRVDMGDQNITLGVIFARPFDVYFEPEYDMRFASKMVEFCNKLVFPVVSAVLPQDNKLKISHVLYYQSNGEVKTYTDLNSIPKKDAQSQYRTIVKYDHFFGFASKITQHDDVSLYFSSNRFSNLNFLTGLKWGDIRPNPPKPKIGDVLCGMVSGTYNGTSESMDYWLLASSQLQLLAKLCTGSVKMSIGDAIENLIVPENETNLPILTEIQESRFLYAGMWLLMNKKQIPEYYNMPKRRNPNSSLVTDTEPFEVWWPRKLLEQSN